MLPVRQEGGTATGRAEKILLPVLLSALFAPLPSHARALRSLPAQSLSPASNSAATARPTPAVAAPPSNSAATQTAKPSRARRLARPHAYPAEWDVFVRKGSKLEELKLKYEKESAFLPVADLEDPSPLPKWFRSLLRDKLPQLPREGTYQYPLVAARLLEWMEAHQDLLPDPPSPIRIRHAVADAFTAGANINLTHLDEVNSESFIAQDYNRPDFLIVGANNPGGTWRQKQFFSLDGGATWGATELPFTRGIGIHSDPAVAFASDGTAWAATLGIDIEGVTKIVQTFKSTDHGKTWSHVADIAPPGANDKEMMWVDGNPASPFRDNIYVVWSLPGGGAEGGLRFRRSTDGGLTWQPIIQLSNDGGLGAHVTAGPSGEVYVAWPDTESRQLRIRKSTDGGASFGPVQVIATTNGSRMVSVPSICRIDALIYVSVGVDRSPGPRRGTVYVTWTDRNGPGRDPRCRNINYDSNSNVYFSASTDGGNTWSSPRVVHADLRRTDQFNQWMDVDPEDGTVHIIFYDTRDDPSRTKTNLYYVASRDGGSSWGNETRITTEQTDQTLVGTHPDQYGDYNGLVAYRNRAFPTWTDRRASNPIRKEQIFTAAISSSPEGNGVSIGVRVTPEATGARREVKDSRAPSPSNAAGATAAYPKEWEVAIPEGTKLARVRDALNRELWRLPPRDAEDRTPIPGWFRVFLRKRNKNLPTSGTYQYLHDARKVLEYYVAHPDKIKAP